MVEYLDKSLGLGQLLCPLLHYLFCCPASATLQAFASCHEYPNPRPATAVPVMSRADRLVGEVVDAAALAVSAFVGWWKLVAKVAFGFLAVVIVNAIFTVASGVKPDVRGYHDGGLVTGLLFGAYGLWVVCIVLCALGRGARNLFSNGP